MPFAGVSHFALSVTNLDISQQFYTDVLGFLAIANFGHARVCMHKPTGFTIGLIRHPEGTIRSFTELNTGLDHIGLTAGSRDELVAWEERLGAAGATFTSIQDTPLGHYLNFRDPDDIALDSQCPARPTPRSWVTYAPGRFPTAKCSLSPSN